MYETPSTGKPRHSSPQSKRVGSSGRRRRTGTSKRPKSTASAGSIPEDEDLLSQLSITLWGFTSAVGSVPVKTYETTVEAGKKLQAVPEVVPGFSSFQNDLQSAVGGSVEAASEAGKRMQGSVGATVEAASEAGKRVQEAPVGLVRSMSFGTRGTSPTPERATPTVEEPTRADQYEIDEDQVDEYYQADPTHFDQDYDSDEYYEENKTEVSWIDEINRTEATP